MSHVKGNLYTDLSTAYVLSGLCAAGHGALLTIDPHEQPTDSDDTLSVMVTE